jgi:ATP-binding cassette subfamily B protein
VKPPASGGPAGDTAPAAALGRGRCLTGAVALVWRASAGYTVAYALTTVVMGAVPVVSAWATRGLLDALAQGRSGQDRLPEFGTLLVVAAVFTGLVPHANRFVEAGMRRRVTVAMHDELFRALNRLGGLKHFESPAHLDRIRLAQESTQAAPGRIVTAWFGCLQAGVAVAGFLGTLVMISPVLSIAVLLSGAPAFAAQVSLGRRRGALHWRNSPMLRRQMFYSSLLIDVRAIKEVRLFNLGDFLRKRMLGEMREIHRREEAVDRTTMGTQLTLAALAAAITAVGLIWAVRGAAAGELSVGSVVLFLTAIVTVQNSLGTIAARISDMAEGLVLFGNFLDLRHSRPDPPVPPVTRPVPRLDTGIEFRDVWFRYGEDAPWILRGFNLVIPAGHTVALVGLNGAGKSTLIKLMCRLYEADRGSILWNGTDITEIDPARLRERIGTVFQDYMAYDLSAAENVGLGALAKLGDRDRIRRAARLAGIDPVLSSLPRGYDTLLSRIFVDRGDANPMTGVTLSGGQWQRVALARGLMREDADLLVLDEPSSGLDAEAEYDIHHRLLEYREGRTTLLVSHRLSTVRDADLIVVLEGGVIVEAGEHDELMAANGRYATLFSLQSAGYAESPARR